MSNLPSTSVASYRVNDTEEPFFAEKVKLLYLQLPPSLLANFVNATLVAYIIRNYFSWLTIGAWLLSVYSITALRLYDLKCFQQHCESSHTNVWANRFVAGAFVNGSLWGIAGSLLVPTGSYLHELFIAFVLGGMSAGAMSSNSSYKPAYFAFLGPALMPFGIRLLLYGGDIFAAMSIMIALYVAMMWLICERHHAFVEETLRLRYENVALSSNLTSAIAEQVKTTEELHTEIDERQRAEQALRSCDYFYKTLVETTGIGYHLIDTDGRLIDANDAYIKLTGHRSLDEIRGRPVFQWIAPDNMDTARTEMDKCCLTGFIRNAEIDYIDGTGRITPVEINATLLHDDNALQLVGVARDITERRKAELDLKQAYAQSEHRVLERTAELAQTNDKLKQEKEIFHVTLASIVDAVITTNAEEQVTFLNSAAAELTGWSEAEAVAQPLNRIFRVYDEQMQEVAVNVAQHCLAVGKPIRSDNQYLVSRDEQRRAIDCSAAPIRNGGNAVIGAVLSFRDVTRQRKLAEQLSHEATHDKLTGLVNRHEFERRMQQIVTSAGPQTPHALLYLDLDQFKVVNDTCGHSAGDELLRQVSTLLHARLRSRDTLARLGGDEFGVILQHCPAKEAHCVAQSLREAIQNFRFAWEDRRFSLSVSIGLAPIIHSGETLSSVLRAADSACYAAKEMGRDRVYVYQQDDSDLNRRDNEMRWMPRIQQALKEDRLCLYFQPITRIGHELMTQAVYVEVLVRMIDEQGRMIPPGAFLPAADRYGQSLAVDRWVVSHSMASLADQCRGSKDLRYSINLSSQSIGTPEFRDFVIEQLDKFKVPADRVCFEIAETAAISDLSRVLLFMDELKVRGCRFALDDFGTGLASFSYLKNLPIDYLKIDGSFVKDLASDNVDRTMVEAIHRIGHVMGLSTIAEWVENKETLSILQTIGVDYAQGYAMGSPQPIHGLAAYQLTGPKPTS